MNWLNFAKRSLAFVLAVTISMPGFASDSSLRFDTLEHVNKSTGASRHNFFIGDEKPQDGTSAVYNNPLITNDFPNMPYFAPYHPNGNGPADERINNGIASFPLVIRLPGDLFGGNLPYTLKQQLTNDGILADNLTIGVVAQNIPFPTTVQLCFRPHTFLYPSAPETMNQNQALQQTVTIGIFESEKKLAKLRDPHANTTYAQNTTHNEAVSVHPDGQGQTVFSPDNMHLLGVSYNVPDSFYTYTRYTDNGPRAVICLHLLMNDAQHGYLQRLSNLSLSNYLTFRNFRKALARENTEFEGLAGLSRIIGLLNHPMTFVVPIPAAKPAVAPAPQAVPRTPAAAPAPQAAPQTPAATPPAAAQATGINLWELWVDGDKLNYDKASDNFLGQGKDLRVVFSNFTAPVNAADEFRVQVAVTGSSTPAQNYDLQLVPRIAEFEKKFTTYEPKTSGPLASFVTKQLQEVYPEHQRFDANQYVDDFGDVKFTFSRPRNIRYSRAPGGAYTTYKHDPETQSTPYKLSYGFEGDPTTNTHELFSIQHHVEKTIMPNMWKLDGSSRLCQAMRAVYTTTPPDLKDWFRQNNISNEASYTRIVANNASGMVLNPPADWGTLALKPEGDALGKYYRLTDVCKNQDLESEAPDYIFVDQDYKLRRAQLWTWRCHKQKETNVGDSVELSDKDSWFMKLAVLMPTEVQLVKPSKGFVENGTFKTGFYRLVSKEESPNSIVQRWEDFAADKSEVTVNISGVRTNGSWAPITGAPNVRPVANNGKTVIDLSNDLDKLNDTHWDSLKNYLQTLFWIERKEPVLKYHYPATRFANSMQVGAKLTKLLQTVSCFDLDLDGGLFLVQDPTGKWAVKGILGFLDRNRAENSVWSLALYPSDFINLIKQTPAVTALDITGYPLSRPLKSIYEFLADSDQLKAITVNEADTKTLKSIGITDAQIMKLVSKAYGFKTLKMADFPKAPLNTLLGSLVNNRDTLDTLDLSGAYGLSSQGDDLVKVVPMLTKLRAFNVLKTNFSNGQVVALAKILETSNNLENLGIDMPYARTLPTEAFCQVYDESYQETGTIGGKVGFARDVLLMPATITFAVIIGTPYNIISPLSSKENPRRLLSYGVAFKKAFLSLAKIPNLNKLKIQVFEWIQNQQLLKDILVHQRTEQKLGAVQLDFEA